MKINISKAYNDTVIFNNLDLNIIDNKINVIIGPSGCGKTTLLQAIANLTSYEGEISSRTDNIGYVFQEDRLFPYLTVEKNLLIIENDSQKISALLKQFNVYELKDKYPHTLSGGEKQRIALIRAFLGDKELILMDEPFKSLDTFLRQSLLDMVIKLYNERNKTIILVTHDLEIAMFLGHYIFCLSNKVTKLVKSFHNLDVFHEINQNSFELYQDLRQSMFSVNQQNICISSTK